MLCLSCFSIRLSTFPHLTKATVSISPSVTYLVIRSTRLLLVCWIARQNMRSKNVAAETFQCLVSFISQDSHCLIKSCVTEQFPAVLLKKDQNKRDRRLWKTKDCIPVFWNSNNKNINAWRHRSPSVGRFFKHDPAEMVACTPCAWLVGQKKFSARVRWLLLTPREKMV